MQRFKSLEQAQTFLAAHAFIHGHFHPRRHLLTADAYRAIRSIGFDVWHQGAGCSIVGDQRLDWEDKDVFMVPTWTFCEHVNSGARPAFLFSFSDAPVMKALSLYRGETRS